MDRSNKTIAICCNKLKKHQSDDYQDGLKIDPYGDIDQPGCCGGGCYIMSDIKYCPWCGTKLMIE